MRLGPGDVLTERAVFLDERVLHHLVGARYLDERVARRSRNVAPTPLTAGHDALAATVAAEMGHRPDPSVGGHDARRASQSPPQRRHDAAVALCLLSTATLPTDAAELEELAGVVRREARAG